MKKGGSLKQRLISAVLVLVMLFTSLLGTTYAWFTDSVTSAGNKIQAGNLKIDLLHKVADNWVSLKDDPTHKVFDYDKWEPGHTRVETLKIANLGSLVLQYRLSVEAADGTAITGKNGENLADVIDVYVVYGESTAASYAEIKSTWEHKGTLTEVMQDPASFMGGRLLPTGEVSNNAAVGSQTVSIALHMQESAGNEYQNLSAGDIYVNLIATQWSHENDSFGPDYDNDATFPTFSGDDTASAPVEVNTDGTVKTAVTLLGKGETVSATVPAGTLLDEGVTGVTLTVSTLDKSESNIEAAENQVMNSVDVHVSGIAADNTEPILVTVKKLLAPALNIGNYQLYHVENGATVAMTYVNTANDLTAHNNFTYDPVTGDVTMALCSFSEIAVVADTEIAWKGEFDYTWYDADATELTIANADQLAGFGAIVGGMAKDNEENAITRDNFENKTVKLLADINLGDKDNANSDLIFYPIGYYNSTGSYEKESGVSVTSDVNSFEGTFDGNGNTISNFYQNTWEMFGDYNSGYSGTPNHYKDAMGLFGYVLNGTVKNLTVDNFSSDGEFTPTGVIAAYAVNSTFENIAITNCNPRVYNTGNGGIVGIGGDSSDTAASKLIFKNITVDNTNKISALWGSWDVACGGLMGMFFGPDDVANASRIKMTNCHVAAQIDVNNDVCGNYQYYWYRYSGMMVGTIDYHTTENGYTVPDTSMITAEGCTVHFGDWNDYYYCELVANSLASYTHDHQFSRLTEVKTVNGTTITYLDGTTGTVPASGRYNYVVVNGVPSTENATCYHFVDGVVWNHEDAGYENFDLDGNGELDDLKEDRQHYYLPFNQLFTGYGWGVKNIPVYNGENYAFKGITILDRENADSVTKFEKADSAQDSYKTGTTVTIGELFKAATIEDSKLTIKSDNVQVTVSPVIGSDSTAGATYIANTTDWTQGTLTFSGFGAATITITDYYFCIATTITINVKEPDPVDKFDLVFENTDDYLYRVGNANTISLGSLFKAKDGVEIGNVTVTVTALNEATVSGTYTANASDWTKGTIQFSGTGPVLVTINDDAYANEKVLYLEVVDAKNITKAESATSNNVVLLNDISGTFTVSNGHTFYGNGFTVKLPTTSVRNTGNGFTGYISIGAAQDDGNANGGNLDNVRIEGPVYPEMYIYRDQAKITDTSDPDYGDGYNMRYFVNSVIVYGGNVTISNCYISGSRTALCLRGGNNVVIENTTLSGGAYANMQICAGSNVTLRDLTTIQTDVTDSYDKGKTAHGLGIAVDSDVVDIYIEGELNQYNWLCEKQWNSIVPSSYQSVFPKFFTDNTFSKYWHYLNGGTAPYVNMAFIFACNWDSKIHDNRTTVDYGTVDATIAGVSGGVYSKVNTVGGNAISDSNLADPGYTSPGFNPIAPSLTFDNTANNDADDANDAADTYCVYDESSGTLKVGVSGDSKTLDLSGVSVTKNGATLAHTAYLNGTQINGNSVTIKAADGAKQTLTFKATSNDAGYDKDGNPINGTIEYTWTVTVEMAVLAYPAPVWNMGGTYKFDTSNCYYAYYQTSQGYGEAVPIYEGIKVNYYDKSGKLVELDLSGTTTLPTGSNNANANAFTYTLSDGSTLTMKYSSGWKSGATTHQFTVYNNKAYIYPQSLDNDNYVRAKTTNQNFDVKITYTFTDPNGQSTETVTMNWYNAAASNGSVSTVQWKTFDSTNGKSPSCVTGDTLVTLADGTQKRIDEVTYEDKLLVWDFDKGEYTVANSSIIENHGYGTNDVIKLTFEDGTTIKVVNVHGFFDADLNKWVDINAENASGYIGHSFTQVAGDSYKTVKLVAATVTTEYVEAWSILTADYYNCILEGMFSVTPPATEQLAFFAIGEDMKYDAEAKQADIEKHGLYTYDEFAHLMTYEAFEALNIAEIKIAVGKGLITYEEVLGLIATYA